MSIEGSSNIEEKKYLTPESMSEIHVIAQDFAKYLQKINKETDEYNLEDEKTETGVNLGIRALIVVLNEYIVEPDGKINLEIVKKIAGHIKDKKSGKTY